MYNFLNMSLLRHGVAVTSHQTGETTYGSHVRRAATYCGGLVLGGAAIKTGSVLWESSQGITDTPHTVGIIAVSGIALTSLHASTGEMMQHLNDGLTHLENRLREHRTRSEIE
jgi:hypothetical protein